MFFFVFDDLLLCFSSRTRRTSATSTLSWASSSRCLPTRFCLFFLGFLGLSGALLPLGWWGPLAAFFPCVFPVFFGWEGGSFFFATSCILRLSLLGVG